MPPFFTKRHGAPYRSVSGAEEIVRIAIELVDDASTNPPTREERDQKRNVIITTWRGARDPIGAKGDVHLRTRWMSAIRAALAKGWNYDHYIQLANDPEKALRSVFNVLALSGPSSRYQACLLADCAPDRVEPKELEPDA